MRGLRGLALAAALVFGALAIGFTLGSGSTARAESGCSVETVRGTYALYGTGVVFGAPWAANGRFVLDGAGHVEGTMVESYGGVIDDGILRGTYFLDPDCRGSATMKMEHRARVGSGAHEYRHEIHRVDVVVASGGQRAFWVLVETSPQQAPPGLPETADPVMASGFLERM